MPKSTNLISSIVSTIASKMLPNVTDLSNEFKSVNKTPFESLKERKSLLQNSSHSFCTSNKNPERVIFIKHPYPNREPICVDIANNTLPETPYEGPIKKLKNSKGEIVFQRKGIPTDAPAVQKAIESLAPIGISFRFPGYTKTSAYGLSNGLVSENKQNRKAVVIYNNEKEIVGVGDFEKKCIYKEFDFSKVGVTCEINIFVSKEHEGKGNGVLLLESTLEAAKESGHKIAMLVIDGENAGMINVCNKVGEGFFRGNLSVPEHNKVIVLMNTESALNNSVSQPTQT